MTIEQALENIRIVLAQYKGTLAEHEALQQSLILLKALSEEKPKTE
jgi:predicted RNase H-like HicB family nuclease